MNLLIVFSKYIYTGVGNYRNDKDTIKLNDDVFRLTVSFNSEGKVTYSFDISDDIEKVIDYDWVNKDSIRSFINKDIDLYLKRFKVDVSSLNEPLDYFKKNNKVNKKDNRKDN